MYHFIPAWYGQDRVWYDDTQEWTHVNQFLQFDDSVNQIRVFFENQEPVRVMVLNYAPNLRSFLHQKGLLEVSVWSLFDHLQDSQDMQSFPMDWRKLAWPQGTSFIYSPFTVTALRHERPYAKIQFATNGHLFRILRYENDGKTLKEELVFDDRGFLSSLLVFENGQAEHQDYFNQAGQWCLREHLDPAAADRISVNPEAGTPLKKLAYANWEELISETLATEISQLDANDRLVIAAHKQHNDFFKETKQPKIFSFYQERQGLDSAGAAEKELFSQAELLVSDDQKNTQALRLLAEEGNFPNVIQVSPFDTRFELGLSIRQKELEVYLFVDNLDDAELKAICKVIFKEMRKNELITLTLGSYQRYGDRNQMIESMLEEMLEKYVPKEEIPEEDQLPDKVVEEEEPRAKFLIIKEENDVIAAFKTSRIIVDMGMKPDLYHQIAAISSGIPQINQVQTDYVTHKENGYIVEDIKGIEKGLSYFFKGLSHWNRSLVYSIEKIAENTGPALINKWKNQGEGQVTDDRS